MTFLSILTPLLLLADTPDSADAIMAKVAAHQEQAEAVRSGYVYHQDVLVRLLHTNGKVAAEESRTYTVAPTPTGWSRDLMEVRNSPARAGEIDREIAHELSGELTGDVHARDGIVRDLFPLTSHKQREYRFRLIGLETYRDRPVYHIEFTPRSNGSAWMGDAYVDQTEYQPVLISTRLAHKVPVAVRVLLGTNIEQTGFKISYQRFEGQWFPENYSGELKVRALFLYSRRIGISMRNHGFQRSAVPTEITYREP